MRFFPALHWLEEGVELVGKDFLGHHADYPIHNLAVFEKEQGRDGADVVSLGDLGIAINVHLGHFGEALKIRCRGALLASEGDKRIFSPTEGTAEQYG